jgi:hypothetical protein
VIGLTNDASTASAPLVDRVAPSVARDVESLFVAPAFKELLALLPELANEERVTVLDSALALARAFAGRRGPT